MPIYFNDLLYDYYLVKVTLVMMLIMSILGVIYSYVGKTNPQTLETIVCACIAISMVIWCLIFARIGIAVNDTWYTILLYGVMIILLLATAIQLLILCIYVKFAYNTLLFRLFLFSVILFTGLTHVYHQDVGMRSINSVSTAMSICLMFILITLITFKFRYYLP